MTRQKQVLSLFSYYKQVSPEPEWYKIGHEYNVEANADKYTVSIYYIV